MLDLRQPFSSLFVRSCLLLFKSSSEDMMPAHVEEKLFHGEQLVLQHKRVHLAKLTPIKGLLIASPTFLKQN